MSKKKEKSRLRKPSAAIIRILSDNMRTFRQIRGLSQEALAEMCGLHRTYIGSIERGERNVTLSTLEVIAETLGVSVPELLTEKNKGA